MSKIAIVYWSGTGNTEAMSDLVAQGVRAKGSDADLINATDFGPERLDEYDAYAFGCPAMGDEELEDMEALSCNTFAVKVNKDDFKGISNELENLGSVEFQWGGFPISLKDLPQKNDEVIFLCPAGRKTRLYRMKVMARGEYEAAKFLDVEPVDLMFDDDTTIFILTNIQGPLSCKNKDLEFLDFQQIPTSEPEGRLSPDIKEHFKQLFDCE